jgi:hypothetical protein
MMTNHPAVLVTPDDVERRAFEEWFMGQDSTRTREDMERDDAGTGYWWSRTQIAWLAWQAARAARGAEAVAWAVYRNDKPCEPPYLEREMAEYRAATLRESAESFLRTYGQLAPPHPQRGDIYRVVPLAPASSPAPEPVEADYATRNGIVAALMDFCERFDIDYFDVEADDVAACERAYRDAVTAANARAQSDTGGTGRKDGGE